MRDSSNDQTVTAPTQEVTTEALTALTAQLSAKDRYTEMMDLALAPGVTRSYTDAVCGCLFVDLSVDARVAAGRAGT